jgi:hypothetical protein
MLHYSALVVVPLVLSILTFAVVFYGRERAYSIRSHNFISAIAALLCLVAYLTVKVLGGLSDTAVLVFLAISVGFAIWAVICTRI